MSRPAVRYRIAPVDPRAHLFEVELTVEEPDRGGQHLTLPVWIPGSYLVREFARNLTEVTAASDGAPVPLEKLDKRTWRAAPCTGPLVVTAKVYAWDLSVRAAHLDTTHGFFNGPSVFLAVSGQEERPVEVDIEPPTDAACVAWRVATSMRAVEVKPTGFGLYRAESYDELIDHPVEMGTFEVLEFDALGTPHEMAITGRQRCDKERLARDLKAICEQQIRFFGAPAPMDRYVFLTTALGEGYGGLEHRASCALLCKRDDLPAVGRNDVSEGYRSFLGLVSHEYFHLWNVKRIKPASFTPYSLDRENYTRLLWAFEGTTSYYDDLLLLRAGLLSTESYLELLGRTATRVWRGRGRHKQSLAESSFDSWIKFYRPDENTANSVVSYYTKGALVALALDLTIRTATADARSLDDVMRVLWERFGKVGKGVGEGDIEAIAGEVAGASLEKFFDATVRGTADPALDRLLPSFGVQMHLRPLDSDSDAGGKPSSKKDAAERGTLGVTLGGGDDVTLSTVTTGGAAHEAGLSAGDVVIAIDGLRTSRGSFTRVLGERKPGERVRLHVFRRDELHELEATLKAPELDGVYFTLVSDAPVDVMARRDRWLKG
jgi:predicted metalloprotease with PDZ domain